MKVVLVERVAKLGTRGDIVRVADGYARNYLIPKGLALEATTANLKAFERERQTTKKRVEREVSDAEAAAGRLEGLSLTVKAKAGEEGRLFGSVTSKDIVDGIKSVTGLELERKRVELEESIKMIGQYEVEVHLGPGISRVITVTVEALEE